MAGDRHAFTAFVLIGAGIFLVDSGIRGRKPVSTIVGVLRNPGNARDVLSTHNGEIPSVFSQDSITGASYTPSYTAPNANIAEHVSASIASEQAYAQSRLASYGWGPSQMQFLDELWNRESGWNPAAENPSSGAYGIPQALPATKMSSAGSDWKNNPETQIDWGMGYIKQRYGTPENAWAHEQTAGWY